MSLRWPIASVRFKAHIIVNIYIYTYLLNFQQKCNSQIYVPTYGIYLWNIYIHKHIRIFNYLKIYQVEFCFYYF
jgi:hypothetical protein